MSNNRKVVDYFIFRKRTIQDLMKAVNEILDGRWEPLGAPFSDCENREDFESVCLCQAMVKYEDD